MDNWRFFAFLAAKVGKSVQKDQQFQVKKVSKTAENAPLNRFFSFLNRIFVP
ncbi:MAG: hypothetical protein J5545_12270 [Bacteroidaceae bacterium]|nr:hypothetical protein [Bacteroidaceae bacterium]